MSHSNIKSTRINSLGPKKPNARIETIFSTIYDEDNAQINNSDLPQNLPPAQKSSLNLKPTHFTSLPKLNNQNIKSGVFNRRSRSIAGHYSDNIPHAQLSKEHPSFRTDTKKKIMLSNYFKDEIITTE